jgi:hypothetical protein
LTVRFFIVGQQNSGKSVQLRSMFRDVRLGTDGNFPAAGRFDPERTQPQAAAEKAFNYVGAIRDFRGAMRTRLDK